MSKIYHAVGKTLVEQYVDVGSLFGENIRASVYKIAKKRSKSALLRKKVAEKTLKNLSTKPECQEFLECLVAWSEGAGIKINQAMWLLADNLSGCQTMMMRYEGGVSLIHTEEEFRDATHIELHMSEPQTVAFRVEGENLRSLVYNNLLPGAGLYGWKKNMIVAVDSLFLREDGIEKIEKPMLANIVSWLIWRMGPSEAEPKRVVEMMKSMGTVVDGYAINVVRKTGQKIEGYKLTFAKNDWVIELLGDHDKCYINQVNIVDPKYLDFGWRLEPRKFWKGGWKFFNKRLKRLGEIMMQYQLLTMKEIFGELRRDFVNPDLGAVCIGLVDLSGTSVSMKLNDNRDISVLEYIDRL